MKDWAKDHKTELILTAAGAIALAGSAYYLTSKGSNEPEVKRQEGRVTTRVSTEEAKGFPTDMQESAEQLVQR